MNNPMMHKLICVLKFFNSAGPARFSLKRPTIKYLRVCIFNLKPLDNPFE